VRQIINLGDVVAVVADHMWAAKQGLAALAIRWDDGPNGNVSTADVVQGLDAASQQPGVVARTQAISPRPSPARRGKSTRCTRCRSWPTPQWSR